MNELVVGTSEKELAAYDPEGKQHDRVYVVDAAGSVTVLLMR